jgi:hypothetical protein
MTGIDRTSRLFEQLRARITADRAAPAPTRGPSAPVTLSAGGPARGAVSPSTMVKRLHDAGVTDERVLVGRLVEGLMLEAFGENTQGANFQFVLGQVVQTLEQDHEAWALCRACVAEAIG